MRGENVALYSSITTCMQTCVISLAIVGYSDRNGFKCKTLSFVEMRMLKGCTITLVVLNTVVIFKKLLYDISNGNIWLHSVCNQWFHS